jgi:hypothetical protein
MLYAKDTKPTRENFAATCPSCGKQNVFNRATDLPDEDRISFRRVTCVACNAIFAINGDTIDPSFAVLLFEVFDRMHDREYAPAITTITQSYEAFFLHTLRELLALKLLINDRSTEPLDEVNEVLHEIHTTTERWAYRWMRNAFIHLALNGTPKDLDAARNFVQRLPTLTNDPPDERIIQHPDQALARLLLTLKRSRIYEVRNAVAHKHAYRPTQQETERLFDEARDTIWPLAHHLDVRHDSC